MSSSQKVGFPGGSDGKEAACNARDMSWVPGLGRSPGEGKGHTHSSILAWRFHEQKSFVGYSEWGCKELDMTKQQCTQTHTYPTECRVPENSKER